MPKRKLGRAGSGITRQPTDQFFELSADMLGTCSTVDWHWKRVNPSFCRTLGMTEDELLGTPFLEVIHPDDRDRTQEAAEELLRGKPQVSVEHRMLCKDKSTRWVNWHTVYVSAEQLLYCVGRDMTERRAMEETLSETKERFRVLVENTSQAVWETDSNGRVVSDSPSWRAYTGFTLDRWLGYGWLDAVHPDDREGIMRTWRDAVASGTSVDTEFRLRGPDGRWRWTNVRSAPIRDKTGKIRKWVGMNVDVTQKIAAEEGLRKVEKLAAAGQMAASVAHEINNPLAAVVNSLYLLRNEDITPTGKKFLEQALSQLDRVIRITRQTLSFHREAERPSRLEVAELARDVVQFMSPVANKQSVELSVRARGTHAVHGYPGQLRQLLTNLVRNSIEANAHNVRVSVVRSTGWESRERAEVRLTVVDDGFGIAKEHLERIFDPFFSTKGERGTGLGLWIARSIATRHGGRILARSFTRGTGKATCISIVLPMADPEISASGLPTKEAA